MKIIMYTKNNCPNCMRAEFMFSSCPTPVEIEKRNVETNSEFMEELKELGSNTLPTIVIGEKEFRGFEENLGKLQEVLGL